MCDDKLVLTFNYKEGEQTVTFDSLKTALAERESGSDMDCIGVRKSPATAKVAGLFSL